MSVPENPNDVSLQVSDLKVTQTISLLTGARGSDAISTFYRKVRGNDLGDFQTGKRPLGADPNGDALSYQAYVENARLAAYTSDAAWAGRGHAWLIVQYERWSTGKLLTASADLQWKKSFSLTVDGTTIGADPNYSGAGYGLGDEVQVATVYFKVPDSITKATFSVHPYFVYSSSFDAASIPVQLPTAKPIVFDFGSAEPAK